ncbi:hypothetical protein Avbf_01991 [Armadillidium vulgare]|nr:hypothetical protein Avbf_01991 [Armadillidium vulgare]
MKFSAEILLTVLMGSLLCFQLALAQCNNETCVDQGGCCCPGTKGCYIHLDVTVTDYYTAEKLCNELDTPGFDFSLPEGDLNDIPIVKKLLPT